VNERLDFFYGNFIAIFRKIYEFGKIFSKRLEKKPRRNIHCTNTRQNFNTYIYKCKWRWVAVSNSKLYDCELWLQTFGTCPR